MELKTARSYSSLSPAPQTARQWLLLLFFFLLFAVFAFMAGYILEKRLDVTDQLKAEGVTVPAIVIDKTSQTGNDGKKSFFITYSFTPLAGSSQPLTVKEDVPQKVYTAANIGQNIDINYARSNPQLSRILAKFKASSQNLTLIYILGSIALLCLLVTLLLLPQLNKAIRLDKQGIQASATIIDKYADKSKDNPTFTVIYQLPGGHSYHNNVTKRTFNRLEVGSQVPVRYMQSNPSIYRIEKDLTHG